MRAREGFHAKAQRKTRKDAKTICNSSLRLCGWALRLCVKYSFLILLAACTHRPAGPLAFVSNERDGTITVIDTATDRVYSTIKVGGRLRGIRLSPDKQKIWVAISYPSNQSQGEDKIAEIDLNGHVIAKYEAGTDP